MGKRCSNVIGFIEYFDTLIELDGKYYEMIEGDFKLIGERFAIPVMRLREVKKFKNEHNAWGSITDEKKKELSSQKEFGLMDWEFMPADKKAKAILKKAPDPKRSGE